MWWTNTKTYLTTYPLKIGEKQVNVARVSVRDCEDCNAIKPTQAGRKNRSLYDDCYVVIGMVMTSVQFELT